MVTIMLQVPEAAFASGSLARRPPCILAAPASGSRNAYGGVGTAGEWGLRKGCAVVYTDKAVGPSAHNLDTNAVSVVTGERVDLAQAKAPGFFIDQAQREDFGRRFPHRVAFMQAHSGENPEAQWGEFVLHSIEYAFLVLNRDFGAAGTFTPENTIVIASSISNGGGSSLRAAELEQKDGKRLIDAVVVAEPNVTPTVSAEAEFEIVQGARPPLAAHSRSLLDYVTLIDLYQGCAGLAAADAPVYAARKGEFLERAGHRCAALKDVGLLTTSTEAEQASEAQAIINSYGILPEQNLIQPLQWLFEIPDALAVTYANSYAGARVGDGLCGFSFAAVDGAGAPRPLAPEADATLFLLNIPPSAAANGVKLVNDRSAAGDGKPASVDNRRSVSAAGRMDMNLAGAMCLRGLVAEPGQPGFVGTPDPVLAEARRKVRESIDALRAKADLGGLPAIIVTGRSDAVLAPNHASRPYYARNQLVEKEGSRLRYYEVTNAHHLDAFNVLPGMSERFVPLHHYFLQALDLMYGQLLERQRDPKAEVRLPPSQVVHTRPRGPGSPPIRLDNLPPITMNPAAAIEMRIPPEGGAGKAVLRIPD